jgi:hypothetical protein
MVEMGNCDVHQNWENLIWPYLIADRLGLDYNNVAMTMSSNQRILRTTLEQLVLDKPDIVVIGWTNMDRIELPLTNGDWARIGPHGCISEKSDPASLYYKDYYQHHYNDWLSFNQTVQAMFLLTTLCEFYKIKLYNLNGVFHNFLTNYNSIITKNFYSLRKAHFLYSEQIQKYTSTIDAMLEKILNQVWLLEPSTNLVDVCHTQNWATDQFGHPTLESQQNIADMFLAKMES